MKEKLLINKDKIIM